MVTRVSFYRLIKIYYFPGDPAPGKVDLPPFVLPDDHLYSTYMLAIFLTISIMTTVSGQRYAFHRPNKTIFSSSCTPCFNPPAPTPPPWPPPPRPPPWPPPPPSPWPPPSPQPPPGNPEWTGWDWHLLMVFLQNCCDGLRTKFLMQVTQGWAIGNLSPVIKSPFIYLPLLLCFSYWQ